MQTFLTLLLGGLLIGAALRWLFRFLRDGLRRRRAPASLALLLLTVLVYTLQVFPLTGFFLMFVAAPFWSVPLVNLAMAGTAVEAATGIVSRRWLILPLAWFGLYGAATAVQHAKYFALRAEIDAANGVVRVPFDAKTRALVVTDVGDAVVSLDVV